MAAVIDTDRFSQAMRARILRDDGKLLISSFEGSDQSSDLTEPANCDNLGRIRHFHRATSPGWPANPLPIDPAAKALGSGSVDVARAEIFQNAACNWRCWYCYVPFNRLSGDERTGRWKSAEELVGAYAALSNRPDILVLSGGQPDLIPEWVPQTMEALRRKSLEHHTYLWSDDNLSNDYFWRYLTKQQIREVAEYSNYGRVGCFKGYDGRSFAFNTQASPDLFDRQFQLFQRLIDTGIDMYAYATFTSDDENEVEERVGAFVDRLRSVATNLPLRLVPLEVREFTPMRGRIDASQMTIADAVQQRAIRAWNRELERRFSYAERQRTICEVALG